MSSDGRVVWAVLGGVLLLVGFVDALTWLAWRPVPLGLPLSRLNTIRAINGQAKQIDELRHVYEFRQTQLSSVTKGLGALWVTFFTALLLEPFKNQSGIDLATNEARPVIATTILVLPIVGDAIQSVLSRANVRDTRATIPVGDLPVSNDHVYEFARVDALTFHDHYGITCQTDLQPWMRHEAHGYGSPPPKFGTRTNTY